MDTVEEIKKEADTNAEVVNTEKMKQDREKAELALGVVPIALLENIYTYLNNRPRVEVDSLCVEILKAQNLKANTELMDKHFKKP